MEKNKEEERESLSFSFAWLRRKNATFTPPGEPLEPNY